jgi:flagellar biosynthesis anti-sigma factor FlgM
MVDPLNSSNVPAPVGRGETNMSDLGNIQGVGSARPLQQVNSQRQVPTVDSEPLQDGFDTVEISFMADMLGRLRSLPDVRQEKVAPIKAAIRNGTYDINSKLDVAIEWMLDDLD